MDLPTGWLDRSSPQNRAVPAGPESPDYRRVPGRLSQSVKFAPGVHYAEPAQAWFADPGCIGWPAVFSSTGTRAGMNLQLPIPPGNDPHDFSASDLRGNSISSAHDRSWRRTGRCWAMALLRHLFDHATRVLQFSLEAKGPSISPRRLDRVEQRCLRPNLRHLAGRSRAPANRRTLLFDLSLRASGAGRVSYVAAVYRFATSYRFRRPMPRFARWPSPFSGETRRYEKLNPAVGEVIYPCGAAYDQAIGSSAAASTMSAVPSQS